MSSGITKAVERSGGTHDGGTSSSSNKEIPAWVPLDPAAQNTKRKWEVEAVYVQRAKAYLEEECPGMLQGTCPTAGPTWTDEVPAAAYAPPSSPQPPCSAGKDQGNRRWVPRKLSQADPAVPSPGDATAQLGRGEKAGVQCLPRKDGNKCTGSAGMS